MNDDSAIKNILILGGGYAGVRVGLDVARFLKKNPALAEQWSLSLIDKNDSHVFTPNLYEMATVLREDASAWDIKKAVALPHREIFKNLPIRVLQDEIQQIDVHTRCVMVRDEKKIPYDILVLALGSETNFFTIEGLKKYSMPLKTVEDAIRIRNAVNNTITASHKDTPAHIVIGGGGPTGVELAGELTRFIHKKCPRTQGESCRENHVTIFEASPSILNGFPPPVVQTIQKRLETLGVTVKQNTLIQKAEAGFIHIKNQDQTQETIPCDILIWAGGIRISPLVEAVITPKDKKGRCLVDPSLEVTLQNEFPTQIANHIYAVGDMACFMDTRTGQPIPGTAYIAIEEAKVAAKNIIREINAGENQKPRVKYFPPTAYPFAIPLGGKYAVFSYGPITIKHFLGWVMRILIDLRYFITILPPTKAIPFWINSVILMIKND